MARRGENIYKRKDGRYEGRYIKGRTLNNKLIFGYVYAHTYSDVKASLLQAKTNHKNKGHLKTIGSGSTADFLKFWIDEIIKKNVKISTYAQYHDRIDKHIIPVLGETQINKLKNNDILCLINTLNKKNFASSTIYSIVSVLRYAIKEAIKLQIIQINPCDNIKLPKVSTGKCHPLTKAEQIQLEKHLINGDKSVERGVLISLYAGLRIGEICALKWKDIDLLTGIIKVRGTLQRVKSFEGITKTQIMEGNPKSKHSLRSIPIPQGILSKLIKWEKGNCIDDYILSNSNIPIEPRTLRSRVAKLTKSIFLDFPFHSLRHTYATRCLESNFDIRSISELLGHSGIAVTSQVYAHSLLEHKKLLVSRLCILSEINKPSNEPSII